MRRERPKSGQTVRLAEGDDSANALRDAGGRQQEISRPSRCPCDPRERQLQIIRQLPLMTHGPLTR